MLAAIPHADRLHGAARAVAHRATANRAADHDAHGCSKVNAWPTPYLLAGWTLEEKVAQLLIVTVEDVTG
jgi:hypothetical protein